MLLCIPAHRLSPLLSVWLRQPEAEAALLDLEAQTAEPVVICLMAEVRVPLGISSETTFQVGVISQNVDHRTGPSKVYLGHFLAFLHFPFENPFPARECRF